jgi:formate/nitrite transporter FocA (FNT family)
MTYTAIAKIQGVNMNPSSAIILLVCSTVGNIIGGRIIVNITKSKEVKENE